ncbi:MAG: hypothetical protein WCD70_14985 [Alphaproteobacteria bacterium]
MSSTKIAASLSISRGVVSGVIWRNKLTKNPGSQTRKQEVQSVSLQEAPVEAWQQAVLPKLRKEAKELGFKNDDAYISLILILLKERAGCDWLHHVTGIDMEKIKKFSDRVSRAGIIWENGKPNVEINTDIDMILWSGLLDGTFYRTRDDKWGAGDILEQ